MGVIRTYRDLIVWQKGKSLAVNVFKQTASMPKSELFGLTGQMRRAAVSIPSNIAEGYARRTRPEYLRSLNIAAGSLAELTTQWEIATELNMVPINTLIPESIREIDRLLSALILRLKQAPPRSNQ